MIEDNNVYTVLLILTTICMTGVLFVVVNDFIDNNRSADICDDVGAVKFVGRTNDYVKCEFQNGDVRWIQK